MELDVLVASADTAGTAPAEDTLFRQIFDHAHVGICLMRERRFVRVNRAMEAALDYAPGELEGRSVETLYARQEDFAAVGTVLSELPRGKAYIHERALRAKSGDLRWCKISGQLVNGRGYEGLSVWVVQDITDKWRTERALSRARQELEDSVRRRTVRLRKINADYKEEVERRRASERELIESREKYRALFRDSSLGLVMTSPEGVPAEINPALLRLVGAPDAKAFEAIARRPGCQFTGSSTMLSLNAVMAKMAAASTVGEARGTISWAAPGGETLWFDVAAVDINVRGIGAAISFDNRTDEHLARDREAEQRRQLAQAGRVALLGQFAAALAHELGQPLNAARCYAAGAERQVAAALPEETELHDALMRLQRHLDQAGDVVHNIRRFIADHQPEEAPIDLAALIAETLDLLRLPLRNAGLRPDISEGAGAGPANGNRVEIQQVLVNLILNAAEAMRAQPRPPRLRISVRRTSARILEIAVSDNGPGIDPALGARIFEPYVTTKPGGMGMGLSMCRTIVEAHGGRLWADLDRKRGAAFRFRLPVSDQHTE